EAPDYEGDEQKQGSEEHRARLGGRIVHREHGVGEALGGVGDRGEHGAPEDRQREQAHTAPAELPEEMEGEGQKTVGQRRDAGLLGYLALVAMKRRHTWIESTAPARRRAQDSIARASARDY